MILDSHSGLDNPAYGEIPLHSEYHMSKCGHCMYSTYGIVCTICIATGSVIILSCAYITHYTCTVCTCTHCTSDMSGVTLQ